MHEEPILSAAHRRQALREHLSGYQQRDREVIDYQMYELVGTRLSFRGPPPLDLGAGKYFTCIGAAQTFGCFCERPFPALLSEQLRLPALNLGYGGAGPEFFERHESLDRYLNGGRFVVLQVMSGRSQSNSLFDCRGLEYQVRRSDGALLSADTAYGDVLYGLPGLPPSAPGSKHIFRRVVRRVFRSLVVPRLWSIPRTRRLVAETRRAWIESHRRLLSRIEVPVVLFWFSRRAPDYRESLASLGTLFGEFPQMVNKAMVAEIRQWCDAYVECVTSRGSPQPLVSRFTGRPATVDPVSDRPDLAGAAPWSHNAYYPSPGMHEDALSALTPQCETIMARAGRIL